jgi:hypothetical protein
MFPHGIPRRILLWSWIELHTTEIICPILSIYSAVYGLANPPPPTGLYDDWFSQLCWFMLLVRIGLYIVHFTVNIGCCYCIIKLWGKQQEDFDREWNSYMKGKLLNVCMFIVFSSLIWVCIGTVLSVVCISFFAFSYNLLLTCFLEIVAILVKSLVCWKGMSRLNLYLKDPHHNKEYFDSNTKIFKFTQSLQDTTNSPECGICISNFLTDDDVLELCCSHQFHKQCIYAWFKSSRSCPFCRRIVR